MTRTPAGSHGPGQDRPRKGVRARVAGALALPLSPLALTGCLPSANAGSSAAEAFESTVSGYEHVADVVATGNNALPFAGSGHASITVAQGTTLDQAKELAGRVRAFAASQSSMTWNSLELEFPGGNAVGIGTSDEESNRRLELLERLVVTGEFAVVGEAAQQLPGIRNSNGEGVYAGLDSADACDLAAAYDGLSALEIPTPARYGRVMVQADRHRFGDSDSEHRVTGAGRAAFEAACGLPGLRTLTLEGLRLTAWTSPGEKEAIAAALAAVPGIETLTLTVRGN